MGHYFIETDNKRPKLFQMNKFSKDDVIICCLCINLGHLQIIHKNPNLI